MSAMMIIANYSMHFSIVISNHCIEWNRGWRIYFTKFYKHKQKKTFHSFYGFRRDKENLNILDEGRELGRKIAGNQKMLWTELKAKQSDEGGKINISLSLCWWWWLTRPVGVFSRSLDPFQTLRHAHEVSFFLSQINYLLTIFDVRWYHR